MTCTTTKCECSKPVTKLAGPGSFRFVVSTASKDCENEKILVSAWTKLGKFPVHVDHDRSRQVGEANVFIRGDSLVADVKVSDPSVVARVDSGELGMASVGFARLESHKLADGGTITTRAELHEISLVAAGCNFGANRIKSTAAITRADLERAIRDGMRSGLGTPAPSPMLRKDALERAVSAALKREAHMAIYRATGSLTAFDAAQRS